MEDIQKSVRTCLTKYADFNGRAARPEYWWFMLILLIASLILSSINDVLGTIFGLATLVPSLSAGARRLHDTGKSGWLQLIWLIPLLGWAVLIYLQAQPGEAGTNKYGAPPAGQPASGVVAPGQQ